MRVAVSVLLLLAFSWAGLRIAFWQPPAVTRRMPDGRRHAVGAVHVHTDYSDGRGSPEEIIAAAGRAGLDFVIITDHNGFGAKRLEGYSDSLLVIVGTEISTSSGHILAFGVPEPTFRFSDDAAEVIEDIEHLGGVAMLAHPDNPRGGFEWTKWDLPGRWGVEILNSDTQWRSMEWIRSLGLLAYPLNPTYGLLRVLSQPLTFTDDWDRLLADRYVPAIAGADAHGYPSYTSLFNAFRNHLVLQSPLVGDAPADGRAIATALKNGNAYIGIDGLGSASGFSFTAEADATRWGVGATVPQSAAPLLRVDGQFPPHASVALLHNGRLVSEATGPLEWPNATAGVYRVEVRLPDWDIPWIMSNPIYVLDAAMQEARLARERVSRPDEHTAALRVLDDFEGNSGFQVASDRSTAVSGDVVLSGAGVDQSAAARLAFTLGTPSAENPSPFASLANIQDHDLSAYTGLTFSIRADNVYRVWLQVRDSNAASEEGTEWWYTSLRTSTDWRHVSVPFGDLRTRDPQTDGRLDRQDVQGILFIVDTGAVKPGTQGTIWVDDLGVY